MQKQFDNNFKCTVHTCEEDCIVHGGHPHTDHGAGQEASSQAPGAGPRDQQLRGVQTVIIIITSCDQQHLSKFHYQP